ncbi:MAG: DUF4315 family protein [Ruminococcus sp.]|nr:MAG: DUF4315 family protein [Ruminococcus sp.]
MKSTSPTRKKRSISFLLKYSSLKLRLRKKKEKLASLKEAKLEAENTEIISIIRNADLSVEDIQEMISDLTSVKKSPSDMAKSQPMSDLKGEEKII